MLLPLLVHKNTITTLVECDWCSTTTTLRWYGTAAVLEYSNVKAPLRLLPVLEQCHATTTALHSDNTTTVVCHAAAAEHSYYSIAGNR
eukprot:1682916-Pyramimonas_sp.AAC.1